MFHIHCDFVQRNDAPDSLVIKELELSVIVSVDMAVRQGYASEQLLRRPIFLLSQYRF